MGSANSQISGGGGDETRFNPSEGGRGMGRTCAVPCPRTRTVRQCYQADAHTCTLNGKAWKLTCPTASASLIAATASVAVRW